MLTAVAVARLACKVKAITWRLRWCESRLVFGGGAAAAAAGVMSEMTSQLSQL